MPDATPSCGNPAIGYVDHQTKARAGFIGKATRKSPEQADSEELSRANLLLSSRSAMNFRRGVRPGRLASMEWHANPTN
jgi:hypothetical protein